jgi:ComF family protein
VCSKCLLAPKPLVADFFCVCCRTPFLNDAPLDEHGRCGLCRLGVNGFDLAYSFGAYEDELRKLIHLFKYHKIKSLAKPLGELLVRSLPLDQNFDVVAPMPLHWLRQLGRGFNQADLLAAPLARRLNVPLARLLQRVKSTPNQAGLTHAKRRANVAGAFRVNSRADLRGKRVLLVDDVLTTGATAGAAAAVLKKAGAKHVTVLTLARVDRRPIWLEARGGINSESVGAS